MDAARSMDKQLLHRLRRSFYEGEIIETMGQMCVCPSKNKPRLWRGLFFIGLVPWHTAYDCSNHRRASRSQNFEPSSMLSSLKS